MHMNTISRILFAFLVLLSVIPGFSQDANPKAEKKIQPDTPKEEFRMGGLKKVGGSSRDWNFNIHIDKEALEANIESAIANAMKSMDALENLEIHIEPIEINLKDLNMDINPIEINIPNINIEPIEINLGHLNVNTNIRHHHFDRDDEDEDSDNDNDIDNDKEDDDNDHHDRLRKDESDSHNNHNKNKEKDSLKNKSYYKDKSDKKENDKAKGLKKIN